jgi:uncharacterized protein
VNNQRVIVFGATGRVGASFLEYALDAGHRVTAFVRTPGKLSLRHANLKVVQGDATDQESVTQALKTGFDAVVMAVGANPLKASTVVQDSVKTITEAMRLTGTHRYLGVSGTAQMPATPLGAVSLFFVRLFIAAATDHQRAYETVASSDLDYALAACPYIKDGARTGQYHLEPGRFPGGFKIISAPDVADFLARELSEGHYHRQAVGIWY